MSEGGLVYELNTLRTWKPSPLVVDPRSQEVCPPLILPPSSTFYDKHLHEKLALKRVVLLPSLSSDILKAVDDTEASIAERKIQLPAIRYGLDHFVPLGSSDDKTMLDAHSVADFYKMEVSRCCTALASMFMYPYMTKWVSIMIWRQEEGGYEPTALEEDFTLAIRGDRAHNRASSSRSLGELTDEDADILRRLTKRFRFLATWEIFAFSEDSETILRDMGNMPVSFMHEVYPATGYISSQATPVTVDASTTIWSLPADDTSPAAVVDSRKASLRSHDRTDASRPASIKYAGAIAVPSSKKQTGMMRTSGKTVEDFVQHVGPSLSIVANPFRPFFCRPGVNLFEETLPSSSLIAVVSNVSASVTGKVKRCTSQGLLMLEPVKIFHMVHYTSAFTWPCSRMR